MKDAYRILDEGETLLATDEYEDFSNHWVKTGRAGYKIGSGERYRRKVATENEGASLRKDFPLCTGLLDYFPDALTAVAHLSKVGNDQHNPGQPLHWARSKSGDEADALMRHLKDRGTVDTDGIRHSTKVAWRALANLQKELEASGNLPISRGSKP